MPMLPPVWRNRLNSPAPCSMSDGGSARSADIESGTNRKPIAMPRPICGQNRSQRPLCSVQWLIANSVGTKSATPIAKSGAGPTRQTSRPTSIIVMAVISADGAIPSPDCQEFQCSTCCVKSGNRKTLP